MQKLILFTDNQIILTQDHEFIDLDYFLTLHKDLELINLSYLDADLKPYVTAVLPIEFTQVLLANNNYKATTVRSALLATAAQNNSDKLKIISRARQLAYWHNDHQFCGRCGAKTIDIHKEHAKQCNNCSLICYPRITPCVLAAVIKGKEILLGRSAHFSPGVYSLLAGFVEVGETAEETVQREVFEESKIKIKNIQYYGSQSWPFPHSLMLAYRAEYESGDIVVDTTELEDARWFNIKSLRTCPELLPAKGSLSRMVLDSIIYHD